MEISRRREVRERHTAQPPQSKKNIEIEERDHPTINTVVKAADFNLSLSPRTGPFRPALRLESLLLPSHLSLVSGCVCACVRAGVRAFVRVCSYS